MAVKRENAIRAAEKYVGRGKLEAAIKEYKKVLRQSPDDINTLNRVGDLYARLEQYDEAVRLFTQIAERYTRDGFFVKAIAIYKKIIKLDPTSLAVYERLAELYHKQGLLNEARTQYQVLADYYQKHDNAASAITIYQRMAELEPENPTFRLRLAELYESQRLHDKALREYRRLADLMIVAGSVDEAVQVYAKALEIGADDLAFVRVAVGGLAEGGHMAAAARVLGRAVELNPEAANLESEIMGTPEAFDDDASMLDDLEDDETLEPAEAVTVESDAFALDAEDTFDLGEVDGDWDAVDAEAPAAEATSFTLDLDDDTFDPPDTAEGAGWGGAAASTGPEEAPAGAPSGGGGFDAPVSGASEGSGEFLDALGDEVFTLDLDDDEIPDTMVAPPADMDSSNATFGDVSVLSGGSKSAPTPDGPANDQPSEGAQSAESQPAPAAPEPEGTALEGTALDGTALDDPEPEFELEIDEFDGGLPSFGEETIALVGEAAEQAEEEVSASPFPGETAEAIAAGEPVPQAPGGGLRPRGGSEAPTEIEIEWDAMGSDLDLLDPPEPPVFEAPSAAPAAVDSPPAGSPGPAAKDPAGSAAEVPGGALGEASFDDEEDAPPAVRREEDLLAEARVFSKYGLREKASARLTELFERQPNHFEGLILRAHLAAEVGDWAVVDETVARIESASPAPDAGNSAEAIAALHTTLREAGWPSADSSTADSSPSPATPQPAARRPAPAAESLDATLPAVERRDPPAVDGPVEAPIPPSRRPGRKREGRGDRIAQLLEDLSLDAFDTPRATESGSFDMLLGVDVGPVEVPTEAAGAVGGASSDGLPPGGHAPGAPAPVEKRSLLSLVQELGLDDDEEEVGDAAGETTLAFDPARDFAEGTPPTAPAGASDSSATPEADLDETGMSWLDDAPAEAPVETDADSIFDEEDDFFDLAAELEAELGGDEIDASITSSMEPQEQSLEEIIEGFKQGVAENLSPEDYDTHFNLGIAYREMGLMDEAIGEFQLASKDERYLVESASMLGICFLEKGLPELSVRWYRKALAAPDVTEEASLGLLYDMGSALQDMGDAESAYKTFVEVYGQNTNFRDVATRLQELAPQRS